LSLTPKLAPTLAKDFFSRQGGRGKCTNHLIPSFFLPFRKGDWIMSTPAANANAHRVLTANDRAEILALIHLRDRSWESQNGAGGVEREVSDASFLTPAAAQITTTWQEPWFDAWEGPIEVESRDLKIEMSDDVACCRGFLRIRGRKKGVYPTLRFGVHETMCFERQVDGWRMVHEHRSRPFDVDRNVHPEFASGSRLRVAWA
jgi:ketosteroid isomerase-like protein